MNGKIKVLVIDSSAVFRQNLSRILVSDPDIEVIATAPDPFIAAGKMQIQIPDVITIDMEMPRMNGLTFLKKIMSQHPIPVVIITDLKSGKSKIITKALQFGAVKVISKDELSVHEPDEEVRSGICEVLKNAAHTKLQKRSDFSAPAVQPKLSADAVLRKIFPSGLTPTTEDIIAIGASTGGTEAIRILLEALPADSPGIVIVQHMPENFTRSFADRLNSLCQVSVKEAENGEHVKRGLVLIAPGNRHMLLKRTGKQYYVELNDGPFVNRHRPSVDVLFRSVALYAGSNSIGVILTGMGDDGAHGLLEMKEVNARTIAQDEASCIVFGMPKEAILLNAADKILPLVEISKYIVKIADLGGVIRDLPQRS